MYFKLTLNLCNSVYYWVANDDIMLYTLSFSNSVLQTSANADCSTASTCNPKRILKATVKISNHIL